MRVNGVPMNGDLYADFGQIETDAGPQGKKKWYQTTAGKIGLVIGAGLAGWDIYELVDDDNDPAPTGATGGGR